MTPDATMSETDEARAREIAHNWLNIGDRQVTFDHATQHFSSAKLERAIAEALKAARREGAEQMREAAAAACDARHRAAMKAGRAYKAKGDDDSYGACLAEALESQTCAIDIRRLPLPGDQT